MFIAGIGSRETPEPILSEMIKVGSWCRENRVVVRSGHADGADYAFEKGALLCTEVYLPWPGFNKQLPTLGVSFVVPANPKYDEMVRKYHPAPDKLSHGAFALMGRNSCQVLGLDLDSPVKAIVCWTKKSGGTQQALRIGKDHNIPILNLIEEQYNSADKVIEQLKKIGVGNV